MHKDTKEKENSNKKWLGRGAFLFVIFHFVTILITTFPESYSSPILQDVSNYYVKPIFSQTWKMFAPCPLTDNNLEYKLYYNGDSTVLIKPSETNFKYHSVYRFAHYGDLAIGEYNLLFWIKRDLDQLNIKPGHILTQEEIKKFKRTIGSFYLKNYLKGASLNQLNDVADSATFYFNFHDVVNEVTSTYTLKNLK
jgi:hypothetical protein